MRTVEPAGVLDDRALPGDRHRQQERVQTGIVEAFTDVATGCEHESGLVSRKVSQALERRAPGFDLDPAVTHDDVRYVLAERFGEPFEMVAPLREDHDSASFAKQFT